MMLSGWFDGERDWHTGTELNTFYGGVPAAPVAELIMLSDWFDDEHARVGSPERGRHVLRCPVPHSVAASAMLSYTQPSV